MMTPALRRLLTRAARSGVRNVHQQSTINNNLGSLWRVRDLHIGSSHLTKQAAGTRLSWRGLDGVGCCQRRAFRTNSYEPRRHIIGALVVNQPGCLAQIANLFAARGYNIDSLVVGRTEIPELSRMTVVMHGTSDRVEQMKKQLEDLVYVAVVNTLTESAGAGDAYVERDLMLVKVATDDARSRTEVIELANLFEAQVIDVRSEQLMLQLAGVPDRIESLIGLLKPYGIIEIHRSGVIAMARGRSVSGYKLGESSMEGATRGYSMDTNDVSATDLPPG